MVRSFTLHIAKFIRSHNAQASSLEVLQYSISIFLNSVIVVGAVMMIALFTGHGWEACTVFCAFIALRYFSGGIHLHSSTGCNLISAFIFLAITHLPAMPDVLTITFTVWSLVHVAWHAPRSRAKNNFAGEKYRIHLKCVAMLIVASNFYWLSPLVAVTFFIQSALMTTTVYHLTRWIDPQERFFVR